MSRYYDILVTNPKTGAMVRRWTSFPNGQTDPGALLVEMDVMTTVADTPVGSNYVRIWGISLQDIGQALNLNKMVLSLSGGMQKGLPLANPAQSGVLCRGTINQAFGNWQGTSQTLELMIVAVPPDAILPDGITLPLNISFRWPFRTSLADAIKATLSVAMPSYSVNVNISPNLVYTEDFAGYYWTITQFAQMLYKLSKGILKAQDYSGISVVVESQTINVFDGTVQPPVKSIAFTDLIGQPTWMGVSQINFKCVMRADIHVGDHVTLPKVQTTTTAASRVQTHKIHQTTAATRYTEAAKVTASLS